MRYKESGPAKKWWGFTQERKNTLIHIASNFINETC